MRWLFSAILYFFIAFPICAQEPNVFDISNVVIGPQRIPTTWLFAEGKWSDAGDHVGPASTQIFCYKAFGFCDVASAMWDGTDAYVSHTNFDILRWNDDEIISVDSSPLCDVYTLRTDVRKKIITLSTSDKGDAKDKACTSSETVPTAVLWGMKEIVLTCSPKTAQI